MAIVHTYRRDPVPGEIIIDRVRSFDQGPRNTGAAGLALVAQNEEICAALTLERALVEEDSARLPIDAPERIAFGARLRLIDELLVGRVVMEHAVIIDFKGPNGEDDVVTLGTNMYKALYSEAMSWFWWPSGPIACERPVDQLERTGRPPLNFAMFAMLQQMVLDHYAPQLLVANADQLGQLDDNQFGWFPRAGCMKTDLEPFREDERKDMTLVFGPRRMRANGDDVAAEWTESIRPKNLRTGLPLKERKPMEDVCDAYLQGYRLLMDRIEERRLAAVRIDRAERKVEREVEVERKAEARIVREAEMAQKRKLKEAEAERKAEARIVREADMARKRELKEEAAAAKKRKREEAAEKKDPPRKRIKKQSESNAIIDLAFSDDDDV